MGILNIVSLAVQAAGVFSARKSSRRAAAADREASAIGTASEKIRNRLARRRTLREARIRRARIGQSASNTGSSFSSGELGALSALTTNSQTSIAEQNAQVLASEGITKQKGISAAARSKARESLALADFFSSAISLFQESQKKDIS